MKFYFLRHPETLANEQGIIYGWTDYDYTEKGYEMLAEMPGRLAGIQFDRIYASPLGRAKRLAKAIAAEREMTIVYEDRIKEMNFGMLEGLDFLEAQKSHKDILDPLFSDGDFAVPGGESTQMLLERAASFLDEIKEEEGSFLIVSHAMFIHSAMSLLLNFTRKNMRKFRIDPCMMVCIEYKDGNSVINSMIPYEETQGYFLGSSLAES